MEPVKKMFDVLVKYEALADAFSRMVDFAGAYDDVTAIHVAISCNMMGVMFSAATEHDGGVVLDVDVNDSLMRFDCSTEDPVTFSIPVPVVEKVIDAIRTVAEDGDTLRWYGRDTHSILVVSNIEFVVPHHPYDESLDIEIGSTNWSVNLTPRQLARLMKAVDAVYTDLRSARLEFTASVADDDTGSVTITACGDGDDPVKLTTRLPLDWVASKCDNMDLQAVAPVNVLRYAARAAGNTISIRCHRVDVDPGSRSIICVSFYSPAGSGVHYYTGGIRRQ